MFRQALLLIWKQYIERNKFKEYTIPKDVFIYQELILDTTNQGRELLI
jgi:hypothetical protein